MSLLFQRSVLGARKAYSGIYAWVYKKRNETKIGNPFVKLDSLAGLVDVYTIPRRALARISLTELDKQIERDIEQFENHFLLNKDNFTRI